MADLAEQVVVDYQQQQQPGLTEVRLQYLLHLRHFNHTQGDKALLRQLTQQKMVEMVLR